MSPELYITCTYCDHHFTKYVYSQEGANSLKCPKCGDKNLKEEERSADSKDVFGYNYKEKK